MRKCSFPKSSSPGAKPKPKPRPAPRRAGGGAAPRRRRPPRRPMRPPPRTTPSTRRATISTRPPARRPTRSATTPSRRSPKAPMRRSRKCCCRRPACRRIPRPSGSIHVRNEHANVQFRINGVMLPDGVTGFGSVLDTEPDRQYVADHRRAAGGVRAAHGGPGRHHDPHRHFQQFRQRQPLRRQPRNVPPSFEYGGTFGGTCPSTTQTGSSARQPPSFLDHRLFSGRAVLLHRPLSADHGGNREPVADAQRHPRFLPAGKRLRLHVDLRRPGDAAEPDRGNRPPACSRFPTYPASRSA